MFTHFSCLLVVACVTVTSASPVKKRDAVPLEEFKLHITSLSNLDLITIAYDGNDYYDDWSKAPKQDYSTGDYIKWGNGPSEEGRTREQHGTIAAIRFESIPTSESPMRVLVEKEAADGRPAQTMNCSITFAEAPGVSSLNWWLGSGIDYQEAEGFKGQADWLVLCTGDDIEGP